MSISSEASTNFYCPPQSFGARMIMVPSVRRQRSILTLRCPQAGVEYPMNTSHIPFSIVRYNSPAQYEQLMRSYGVDSNSHGNEHNTKKSLTTNSLKNDEETKQTENEKNDDPIDLSSTNLTNLNSFNLESTSKENSEKSVPSTSKSPDTLLRSMKKEPMSSPDTEKSDEEPEIQKAVRKRKSVFLAEEANERDLEGWFGHVKPVPGIPRQAGSKREEVIKAARSLFSKRTRTLYHWLYPTTSKNKLKATVAAAWDTLSLAEKDFYVSQVLGRFGVPAGSLMVNPQLGGFKGLSGVNFKVSNFSNDETGRAVSSLLLSEEDVSWSSYPQAQNEGGSKKRRRHTKGVAGGSSSSRQHATDEEETLILKQIREEALEDDFADDPELSKEFEQFRWALHVSNAPQK